MLQRLLKAVLLSAVLCSAWAPAVFSLTAGGTGGTGANDSFTADFQKSLDVYDSNASATPKTTDNTSSFQKTLDMYDSNGGTPTTSSSTNSYQKTLDLYDSSGSAKSYIDNTKSYSFGGVIGTPGPSPSGEIPLLDVNGSVDTGGILGCSGLDISNLLDQSLGVGGAGISDLSKQMAEYFKTMLAKEALTRVFSNPMLASVLDSLQALGTMRVSILQEKCDANEIMRSARNKRLKDEAYTKCAGERGPAECEKPAVISQYVENVVESPRWQESFQDAICGGNNNCVWKLFLGDKKVNLSDEQQVDEKTGKPKKDVTPPIMTAEDVQSVGEEQADDLIRTNVMRAEEAVREVGYTEAMKRALSFSPPGKGETEQQAEAKPETTLANAYEVGVYANSCLGNLLNTNFFSQAFERNLATIQKDPQPTDGSGSTAANGGEGGSGSTSAPASSASGSDSQTQSASQNAIETTSTGAGDAQISPPVASKRITSSFGMRIHPTTGKYKMHTGVDFGVGQGTPVMAAFNGRVTAATLSPTAGGLIYLDSPDGNTRAVYMHLSAFNVSQGAGVSTGTVLGLSGGQPGTRGAGRSTGPHLHFEVKENGRFVDPAAALGDAVPKASNQPDPHGDIPAAAQVMNLSADNPMVQEVQGMMNQVGGMITDTTDCIISREINPQVYVKIALLPPGEQEGFIAGLKRIVGLHAALGVYNALINDLTLALAKHAVDSEKGMNPELMDFGNAQMLILETTRNALKDQLEGLTSVSNVVAQMNIDVDARADALESSIRNRPSSGAHLHKPRRPSFIDLNDLEYNPGTR